MSITRPNTIDQHPHLTQRGANLIKHPASARQSTSSGGIAGDILHAIEGGATLVIPFTGAPPRPESPGDVASGAGHAVSGSGQAVVDAAKHTPVGSDIGAIARFFAHLWNPLRILEILMGIALALMGIHTLVK